MRKVTFLALIILGLICLSGMKVAAQKLPIKQEVSLFAPPVVKIDGQTMEWGDKFQAYNNATNIYYTIANDNNNLYLVARVTDPLIIRKVISGGITLTINTEKDDSGKGIAITYPAFSAASRPAINLNGKPAITKNSASDKMALDSFVSVVNKRVADKSKEIKVKGISSISDSLVSIYNDKGIKAASHFDDQLAYIYELAIPLSYYGNLKKFNYTITLSGSPQIDGVTIVRGAGGEVASIRVSVGPGAPGILNASEMAMIRNPTYLKGEYTLAVKQ